MMSCAFTQNIDPTLLLTAFLPILLFAGAFALEWHTVRRLIWSSLLLAGAPRDNCIACSGLATSQPWCAEAGRTCHALLPDQPSATGAHAGSNSLSMHALCCRPSGACERSATLSCGLRL